MNSLSCVCVLVAAKGSEGLAKVDFTLLSRLFISLEEKAYLNYISIKFSAITALYCSYILQDALLRCRHASSLFKGVYLYWDFSLPENINPQI